MESNAELQIHAATIECTYSTSITAGCNCTLQTIVAGLSLANILCGASI